MANNLRDFSANHRIKLLSVAAVVLLYAVLGFFLAPWLIKKNAIDALEMDDPNGEPFARLDQFYANFQLSSLFRWALTFAEFRFDAPELFIARDASGEFNLALLSAYIRDNAGFEVVRGDAGVELDYSIDTLDGGQFQARVDNFDVSFDGVLLRTFGLTASDGTNIDRDVFEIPRFRIDGGSLRYPEREAEIGSISIEDGVLGLYRNASGDLNILHHKAPSEGVAEEVGVDDDTSAGTDWAVSLDRVDIERIEIALIDDSVSPAADIGIQSLDVSVAAISNVPDARFPLNVSISTRGGGSVKIEGEVGALPAPAADLDLVVEGIKLTLLAPYMKNLADVSLDVGDVGLNASLHVGPEETLSLSGDAEISNFLITETDEGSILGSWDLLAADGSVNLGRVAPGKQSAEEVTNEEALEPRSDEAQADPTEALPLAVTIGRVLINDASADFADLSLPLPFDVKIAELNGTLTTIASQSSEPSEATLEGKVDEFGLVQVSGTLTPLQIALNTDLKVNFENVAMPKFSAYSVLFAGREIANGKLDLFLGYRLEASELVGENKIVLRDFELGEKVDHPGATSLPLGLAVALLKNPDGTIDIDLPVRGNVDDPEFRYGSVVGKALVNLVVKIVASPFALLGKLVGAEADELEFIALRTLRLDELVEERISAMASEDGDDETYAKQKRQVLEEFFDDAALAEVRTRFTTEDNFDELAYTNELRSQQIAAQNLAEVDFVALSAARAANVRAATMEFA